MTETIVTGSMLSEAAGWVARICPAKPTIPALGGMMLDATSDELRLTAYDYETAATARIPAVAAVTGRMLVSGRLLAAVAKTVARDVNVTICDTGGQVRVVCGKSEWRLPSLPIADYPTVPGLTEPVSEVYGEDLLRAIARVLPATDRKGQFPALGGVQLSTNEDVLTITATDRFRLATADIPWKPCDVDMPTTVVPWHLLDDAARAVHSSEPARIGVSGGSFTIATDTHTLTGRTIGDTFPVWRRLMPEGEPPAAVVVQAARLAQAAEQALVVLSGNASLRLDFSADGVEVSAVSGEESSARAAAPVESYRGEPMAIAVNPQYLRDALTAAGTAAVEIRLGASASRPILVCPTTPGGGVDATYRHLLMPVKLQGP